MKKTNQIKSINITKAALLTAFLICIYLVTCWIKIGESVLQLTDGIFIWLCLLIPNEITMLLTAIIYPAIIDIIGGGFIFIPISISVHVGIYFLLRIKKINKILKIFLSSLMVFIYIPYEYLVFMDNDSVNSLIIKELVVDSIQSSTTLAIAMILTYQKAIRSTTKSIFTTHSNKQIINK